MGLWRCQSPSCSEDLHGRLGFDFEADQPKCPKCARTNIPGRPERITKLAVIHYDPPTEEIVDGFKRGLNEWACQPGKTWKGGHATGDAIAVNCPACKKTEIWRKGMEAMGEAVTPPEADFALAVDPETKVIRLADTLGDRESCCG